jgi:hypothetical protein
VNTDKFMKKNSVVRHEEPVPHVHALVYWQHHSGRSAYCLLRAYRLSDSEVIAILSATRMEEFLDARADAPLLDDFPRAATAALPVIRANLSCEIEQIEWIQHSGGFSTFDTLQSVDIDDFEKVSLIYHREEALVDQGLGSYHVIDTEEILSRLPVPLKKVDFVIEDFEKAIGKYQ